MMGINNPVLNIATEGASKTLVPYYQSKNITLYNAKFEDVLPTINQYSVDLLLTDPPYATTNLKWDKPVDWEFFWKEAHRLCKPKSPMVLFASGQFVNKLINTNQKHYRYDLIWEKNNVVGFLRANQRPLQSHENIIFFSQLYNGSTYNPQMIEGKIHKLTKDKKKPNHYGGKSSPSVGLPKVVTNLYHPRSVVRFSRDSKTLHPTQKPLALMEWLINSYSNRNDLIIDPFAGSGSTLVGALNKGRKAIGVEQSEEYCEIIAKRLESGK